jgi:hypothetical protein
MFSSIDSYNRMNKTHQNVYYNIDIINGKQTNVGGLINDPIASFSETRDQPIIDDISKYKMSIIRFTMNGLGRDIPLFIPTIEKNQNDPNKTIYKITIEKSDGTRMSRNIIFKPEVSGLIPPSNPFTKQILTDEYYYVHTYNHFNTLINETIETLKTDLTLTNKPYVVFNSETKKFDIYIPKAENIKLYFNANLYNLLSNYPSVRNYEDDDIAYKIDPINPLDLNEVTANSIVYIKVVQEYTSLGTIWRPISSIVFTSNMLPIISENVAPPVLYGDSNINAPTSSISNYEPIITDIALTLDNAYDYKQFISYIPTSQYRYVSFTNSNQSLKSVNVNIYWKTRLTGDLVPLRLSNLSNITIKILFERL